MKICIFGAGAIGGLLGVKLARSGHDISFVARGAHLDALRRHGATLLTNGHKLTVQVACSDKPADLGQQDVVILATKATAASEAARAVSPLLGRDTAIVTAMNGVPFWYFHKLPGKWADLRVASVDPDGAQWDGIGPDRAIGCVVYAAGEIEAPGVIRHISGKRFILGEIDGTTTPRISRIAEVLTAAGFDAPVSGNIRAEIWGKLWGNLSFNPVSALTHATLDVLATDANSRPALRAMMEEAAEVARRLGINLPMSVDTRIEMASKVGAHKTSMLQDLERGRPLEIDALLGAVVEMARLVGAATPMCDTILGLVRQRARVAAAAAENGPSATR
jgi:2-dehydropantoate 2-reductase